ncbi:MAG TPA: multiprotein bridging factor aMBF1 [Methanoregulaceae archaeon]|nr:multiprotein bridging factor aMBF1 [Methanoregulaceae archaeon]HOV67718.1 multiprotein bridging factor aMBF1 [Methanoregulaceae archaeon]HQJ87910.1 multiprotein bridging factor aMBF1 [Methanoregulaceae archaeon]
MAGPGKRVRIEGAELLVCPSCARYGTEVQQARQAPRRFSSHSPTTIAPTPARRRRDLFDQLVGELVDDYGERIRAARVEKGLSTKDLALAIKEKELLVKKIEKGELVPEDGVRAKIEKFLEIRLLDVPEDAIVQQRKEQHHISTTLGDVLSFRKSPKS